MSWDMSRLKESKVITARTCGWSEPGLWEQRYARQSSRSEAKLHHDNLACQRFRNALPRPNCRMLRGIVGEAQAETVTNASSVFVEHNTLSVRSSVFLRRILLNKGRTPSLRTNAETSSRRLDAIGISARTLNARMQMQPPPHAFACVKTDG